jgi:hypothetical protein
MSAKGEANRFDRVDAENDPAYFVKFLDARKSIAEDAIIKRYMVDLLQPLAGNACSILAAGPVTIRA